MNNRILITGATGFVGKKLLKRLVSSGYKVRCIVRNKKKADEIKNSNADVVFGDITKIGSIKNFMQDIDAVFHLAVMASVSECISNPRKTFETNTLGTLNLLEEIREETEKTKREIFFVYLSSDRVYGKCSSKLVNEEYLPCPSDPYAVSKLNSELLIKCYNSCYANPSYAILRSANIYGYGQSKSFFIPSVISQLLKRKPTIEVGNTSYYRNFIYIEDLIDALMLVLKKREKCKNMTFNVAESSVKISDVLDSIKKFAENYLNTNLKFSKKKQLTRLNNLESKKFVLDCSKIKKIGWNPKTEFNDGLRKTFELFLKKNE